MLTLRWWRGVPAMPAQTDCMKVSVLTTQLKIWAIMVVVVCGNNRTKWRLSWCSWSTNKTRESCLEWPTKVTREDWFARYFIVNDVFLTAVINVDKFTEDEKGDCIKSSGGNNNRNKVCSYIYFLVVSLSSFITQIPVWHTQATVTFCRDGCDMKRCDVYHS